MGVKCLGSGAKRLRSDSGSAAYLLCDLGQNSSPFYACVFVCRVEGCCDI